MNVLKTCAAAAMIAAGATAATAAPIDAVGSGWIYASGTDVQSNSGGFGSGINNHYAGFYGGTYHDYFEFAVPNTTVTSATLSIFNSGLDHTIDPTAVYSFYAASDFTFDGLVNGSSFGSVGLAAADTGVDHYVNLTLNSDGLAFLNANLGTTVHFGGGSVTAVDPAGCFDCVGIFGYTGGEPVAQLYINESPSSPTPEPATWAMMIVGFGLVGVGVRRRATTTAIA